MLDHDGAQLVPGAPPVPAIAFRDISKNYSSIQALSGVSFEIAPGTIHALVGQNGAGKSTALSVLAGKIQPSSGQVELSGAPVTLSPPRRAHEAGVVAIYQELTIIPQLSAVENVFLGQSLSSRGFISIARMRARFRDLCKTINVSLDPDAIAGSLSVADQQILEIMRGVQSEARILLFDEPTASLAPAERKSLFRLMDDLRRSGHTMAFVSHNLDEVFEISDAITVFRNGRHVSTRRTSGWTKEDLVAAMLGETMTGIYHRREAGAAFGGEVFRVENVSVPGMIDGIGFSVLSGEIVGVAGLAGSGRSTLLRALAGAEPSSRGTAWLDGMRVPWPRNPIAARRLGVSLVPEERKTDGLVLSMSAADNITLPDLGQVSRAGLISGSRRTAAARDASRSFSFDPSRLGEAVGNLSGGNQQKALLARWRYSQPRVLLVDEPTRGIDIGAKAEILDALRTFSDAGVAVVVVSSELEEIVSLADRVVVLAEGHKVGELHAARGEVSLSRILSTAFAVEGAHV
jgi:ABC-type sugar transport system ATPase subunit